MPPKGRGRGRNASPAKRGGRGGSQQSPTRPPPTKKQTPSAAKGPDVLTRARAFLMLEEDADYNRVRGEIRLICNELDVFNMSSDRWLDACCRTVDQITHFSRHQKFRRYWNERDYSAEGRVFFAYLKSIVADAGGNVRARYKADHGATGETQYITDCYHLSDGEDSCDEDTEQIRRHSRAARVAAGTRLQRAYSVAIGRRKWIPEVRVRVDGSLDTDNENDGNAGANADNNNNAGGGPAQRSLETDDDDDIERLEMQLAIVQRQQQLALSPREQNATALTIVRRTRSPRSVPKRGASSPTKQGAGKKPKPSQNALVPYVYDSDVSRPDEIEEPLD